MTSFVVRCFEQAKAYIGIDQRIIDRATNFIIKQQLEDGRFKVSQSILPVQLTTQNIETNASGLAV